MCSNIGTPKTINFPFGTNGKIMVLGVSILQHFRVECVVFCVIRKGIRRNGGRRQKDCRSTEYK